MFGLYVYGIIKSHSENNMFNANVDTIYRIFNILNWH